MVERREVLRLFSFSINFPNSVRGGFCVSSCALNPFPVAVVQSGLRPGEASAEWTVGQQVGGAPRKFQ